MAAVRGGPPILLPQDVYPLIQEATDLFVKGTDPRAGRVEIVSDVCDNLPPVKVDGGRVIQVLLNLLGNAYEAILADRKGGGDSPAGQIAMHASQLGDGGGEWVVVEVADSGPGIPENHLPRIFEPFYTTKPTGSGYGLYLASEILREHGGRLTATNGPDGGAKFSIWLPVSGKS